MPWKAKERKWWSCGRKQAVDWGKQVAKARAWWLEEKVSTTKMWEWAVAEPSPQCMYISPKLSTIYHWKCLYHYSLLLWVLKGWFFLQNDVQSSILWKYLGSFTKLLLYICLLNFRFIVGTYTSVYQLNLAYNTVLFIAMVWYPSEIWNGLLGNVTWYIMFNCQLILVLLDSKSLCRIFDVWIWWVYLRNLPHESLTRHILFWFVDWYKQLKLVSRAIIL